MVYQNDELQPVEQRLERLEQRMETGRHNERARRFNRRSVSAQGNAALQPLHRDEAAAAGGAHQLGALPPPGMFPANAGALAEVGVVRPCGVLLALGTCRLRSDGQRGQI